MTKHTPGPWRVWGRDQLSQSIIRGADKMTWIALACDFNKFERDAEREANARLIAAAPELLAALQEFLSADISGDREVRLHGARAQARAAIAKATKE